MHRHILAGEIPATVAVTVGHRSLAVYQLEADVDRALPRAMDSLGLLLLP